MQFIALKGWNYHTQAFDTLEEFFDPRLNPNFRLPHRQTYETIEKGLKKVFPTDLLMDYLLREYGNDEYIRSILSLVLADEEIPTAIKLGLHLYKTQEPDFHDEDEDDDYERDNSSDQTVLWLDTCYYIKYDRQENQIHTTSRNTRWILEGHETVEELAGRCIFHLKTNYQTIIDDPATNPLPILISAKESIHFQSQPLRNIWLFHFNQMRWYHGFRMPNNGLFLRYSDGNESYTADDVLTLLGAYAQSQNLTILLPPSDTGENPGLYPCLCWVEDPNDRSRLYRTHNYGTRATNLIQGVLREEGEEADVLYGVELEVATSVTNDKIINASEKLYCIAKSDSTINGNKNNRIEIVSIPATMKAHKKYWHQILHTVGYDAFDCTKNTTNGMHVHVDMAAFNGRDKVLDLNHQKQFIWFFTNPVNRDFQVAISERDQNTIDKWAAAPKFPKDWPLPQVYKNLMSYVLPPYRGIINFKGAPDGRGYVTLEVRAFKGLVSLASIYKNLEFVDSVFNFTSKAFFQSNTIDSYLSYMQSLPANRYSTLREFFTRIDMNSLVSRAQLRQLLWGMDNPEKIKKTLAKHQVPITPERLAVLNTLIPMTKFDITNKGELRVVETNRSALHDLDMGLHEKLARFKKKGAMANVSNNGA